MENKTLWAHITAVDGIVHACDMMYDTWLMAWCWLAFSGFFCGNGAFSASRRYDAWHLTDDGLVLTPVMELCGNPCAWCVQQRGVIQVRGFWHTNYAIFGLRDFCVWFLHMSDAVLGLSDFGFWWWLPDDLLLIVQTAGNTDTLGKVWHKQIVMT